MARQPRIQGELILKEPHLQPVTRATIWVVDDSPLETQLAKAILEPHHHVETFDDGATMLERISQGVVPDVLVLDWHMPNMSGLEVCRFLRKTHDEASLPILILTATGERDDLLEGLAVGANDFVTKDFASAELVARVATLVRARRLYDYAKQSEQSARRALAAAEQANRAKDVFLATVSHELRTPLNSLLGWAALVGRPDVEPGLLRRGLDVIERNAKIQVQLIEDILDISRVIAGKLHLESTPVNLTQVVSGVIDSSTPAAESRGLSLQVELEPSVATVGDPNRLHQAVSNVLSNAIKFSRTNGRIGVRMARRDAEIEIQVKDDGAGITADFLPYVFDRFRQQDSAASRIHSGLGLGLALVKSIVEAHGGRVRVESAGKNQGATVTLTLPDREAESVRSLSAERPSDATAAPRASGSILDGVDVLIVEDDSDASDLLRVVMESEGGQVRQAFSAAQALSLFSERKPTILVSDVGLPGADGYELMREIRARESGAPVIGLALTAYAGREDQRRAIEAGFQAHVAKPVEPRVLIAAMANLLDTRK